MGQVSANVGDVLGLTALPWTLKLVNGFIMDRYTFLAMGMRRVWIIGARDADDRAARGLRR